MKLCRFDSVVENLLTNLQQYLKTNHSRTRLVLMIMDLKSCFLYVSFRMKNMITFLEKDIIHENMIYIYRFILIAININITKRSTINYGWCKPQQPNKLNLRLNCYPGGWICRAVIHLRRNTTKQCHVSVYLSIYLNNSTNEIVYCQL